MSRAALANNKVAALKEFSPSSIVCSYSSRTDGNLSLSYGGTAGSLGRRNVFLGRLGIDYRNLVCAKQVHASNIEYVTHKHLGRGALDYSTAVEGTDGFITDKRNLPLAIFTADCLSVFLYDPATPAVGIVHAGWRSSKEGICAKAVRMMCDNFGTDVSRLMIMFGPAIRDCCYEVKEEFTRHFHSGIGWRNGNYYADLAGINRNQILESGVKIDNIFDANICTSCHSREFFSFRRQGAFCGRMMSVIMLK